ncbi:MAG: hypothetical protein JXD18_03975 [Anaerolineae bacterium]|nr:hypothetical protein [Anaerolineae bacterium]
MAEELRSQICVWLAERRVAVLSAAGPEGVWTIPVHCRAEGMCVACLLPRWADALFYLEQDPHARLVMMEAGAAGALRWLLLSGEATPLPAPDWSDWFPTPTPGSAALYQVVRLIPTRIEWVDESQGWGARVTLDV